MHEAVICEPVRTPVGRMGGVLREVTAAALVARLVGAVLQRANLDPDQIDDVILGQAYPNGEAPAIGRVAALDAGLPIHVPGFQLDRRCGSGLQAVLDAAMQIQTGVADVILAGGVESMSQVEHYGVGLRNLKGETVVLHDRLARARVTAGGVNFPIAGGMLETAENLRREYSITRYDQDALALESHQRAVAAQNQGRFDEEIVSVAAPSRNGEVTVERDEHPRSDTSIEQLGKLRPILAGIDPEATVTAGNASGQNDAAALCIVTSAERAQQLGLRSFGRLRSWACAGVSPQMMGLGPVPATRRALERADLRLEEVDLIELNEAFAAQVLAVTKEWKFGKSDFTRMNVNGSGISIGHPVGATGMRLLTTLLHEMNRREARYGLATMCIGGGQGLAALFEAPSA